jgi:hypothetical protein
MNLNSFRKRVNCSVGLVSRWYCGAVRGWGERGARCLCPGVVNGARGKLVSISDIDRCGVVRDSGWAIWVMGFAPCLLQCFIYGASLIICWVVFATLGTRGGG